MSEKFDLLESCVDFDVMDRMFQESCSFYHYPTSTMNISHFNQSSKVYYFSELVKIITHPQNHNVYFFSINVLSNLIQIFLILYLA